MKIIDLLTDGKQHISCELFPPKIGSELTNAINIVSAIALLHPSYMSVTYGAGGSSAGHTVALAEEIEKKGIPALAHLTCVNSQKEELDTILDELKRNNVENILALRGDLLNGANTGLFTHSNELIGYIKKKSSFCTGGACYPEGHPESASIDEDVENIKRKTAAGVDFLVSQMFFDNNIFYNYTMRLLKAGISVPVIPGIMPVVNAGQIKRICSLSGTKLPPIFRNIVDKFGNRPVALKQAGIVYATHQILDLFANGFDNVHVYTMNNPEIISGIMTNLKNVLV